MTHLHDHVAAVDAAVAAGADVRGCSGRSLLDNVGCYGYSRRFGVVRGDDDTQQRTLEDSALRYRDLLASWPQR